MRTTLFLLLFPLSSLALADFTAEVTHVRDGDTLECGSRVVRLANIDAPESDQPHGTEADRALRSAVSGKRVRVETRGRGNHGRITGEVYLEGRNINARLVREGHAWVYDQYNQNSRLPKVEAKAREADRGLVHYV